MVPPAMAEEAANRYKLGVTSPNEAGTVEIPGLVTVEPGTRSVG